MSLTDRGTRVMVPWYDEFGNVRGWMTGYAGPVVKAKPPLHSMRPVEVLGRVYWRIADLTKECRGAPRWPTTNGKVRFGW